MLDFQTILFKKQKNNILEPLFGGIILPKEAFKMASYHFRFKNDTKPNETQVSAKCHADYILREGESSQKAVCILTNHYYAYAIHEKSGAISGEKHPHVHIMFSEQMIDNVEKIKERPAYKYFTRAAKPLKGEKVASFE